MTTLLAVYTIIGAILTIWLIAVPASVVAGTIKAFRRGGLDWKGWGKHV